MVTVWRLSVSGFGKDIRISSYSVNCCDISCQLVDWLNAHVGLHFIWILDRKCDNILVCHVLNFNCRLLKFRPFSLRMNFASFVQFVKSCTKIGHLVLHLGLQIAWRYDVFLEDYWILVASRHFFDLFLGDSKLENWAFLECFGDFLSLKTLNLAPRSAYYPN